MLRYITMSLLLVNMTANAQVENTKSVTMEQFQRDFANHFVKAGKSDPSSFSGVKYRPGYAMNESEWKTVKSLPVDNSRPSYHAGQIPPQPIFNPFALAEFRKAWKRQDLKRRDIVAL